MEFFEKLKLRQEIFHTSDHAVDGMRLSEIKIVSIVDPKTNPWTCRLYMATSIFRKYFFFFSLVLDGEKER